MSLQNTPRGPQVPRHLKTATPPEFDVQNGAAEQHADAPQSWPSHEPAGAAHLPFVHDSPLQHPAEGPQLAPVEPHVVVFAVHLPDTQRPEQHALPDAHEAPSSLHAGDPVAPHAPSVQRPVQQAPAFAHAAPSGRHVDPLL